MGKKSVTIWLFSSLTLFSGIHFVDALSAFLFNTQIKLLSLYPLVGQRLQETLTPQTYLWISAALTFILWGVTCAITFENPVEVFLNKILSDARNQNANEAQALEGRSEILDAMYEEIESSNEIVSYVKDMVYNVRTEVKEIKPLSENIEVVKKELINLKKEVKRLEGRVQCPTVCRSCGKALLPEFKICPYCGERTISVQIPEMVTLKEYR